MIIGIGSDLCSIDRIVRVLEPPMAQAFVVIEALVVIDAHAASR